MVRVLSIGGRRISDIMTPRREIDWVDVDDDPKETLRIIRECRHDHLLVGRGNIDEPLGMIVKQDLLDRVLDGERLDPLAAIRQPIIVHEAMPIFRVLDQFKRTPIRLALIVDEYGGLEGIVTQTDLLEAMAGDMPEVEGEEPDIVERQDGSLLIDGMMPAYAAFDRLQLHTRPQDRDFHTIAGFALSRLGHLPEVGEQFDYGGWVFEIIDMDDRRIDKLLARRVDKAEA